MSDIVEGQIVYRDGLPIVLMEESDGTESIWEQYYEGELTEEERDRLIAEK